MVRLAKGSPLTASAWWAETLDADPEDSPHASILACCLASPPEITPQEVALEGLALERPEAEKLIVKLATLLQVAVERLDIAERDYASEVLSLCDRAERDLTRAVLHAARRCGAIRIQPPPRASVRRALVVCHAIRVDRAADDARRQHAR